MDAKDAVLGSLFGEASTRGGEPSADAGGAAAARRTRRARARTIAVQRMSKRERELGRWLHPDVVDVAKPVTREECTQSVRPCPFVSCKHHLYLDVSPRTGAIKLNFPDLEVWEVAETCALDVADRGGATLEDVGTIMNLTRERVRQVEATSLAKLEARGDVRGLFDGEETQPRRRRLPVLADDDFDVETFVSAALDAE